MRLTSLVLFKEVNDMLLDNNQFVDTERVDQTEQGGYLETFLDYAPYVAAAAVILYGGYVFSGYLAPYVPYVSKYFVGSAVTTVNFYDEIIDLNSSADFSAPIQHTDFNSIKEWYDPLQEAIESRNYLDAVDMYGDLLHIIYASV